MILTKLCRSRKHSYPVEDPSCRECRNARMRNDAKANPKERNKIAKSWYKKNKKKAKVRITAREKLWRALNPDIAKGRVLRKYWPGSTAQEAFEIFTKMLELQKNLCAICDKPETSILKFNNKIKDLCVDHCHKTGKVRGLLCSKCNCAIGLMEDNSQLLQKSTDYVKKFE